MTTDPHAEPSSALDAALNQSGALAGYNAFLGDRAFREAVTALGADWASDRLSALGAAVGSAEVIANAEAANRHPPNGKATTVSATVATRSPFIRLGMR
ncbi:hypothetical protein QWZ10_03850 [Paracoccus cavernae]|uniref:Adaptive response protein AidB N-terminal domain-containing protein n=1 Tax=Paracoccus cavernae TaxID=1571207 RepID=A0ABT8D5S2_9RHOB|nr:hypothetical protein [Paracoccus cavernae]